MLSSVSDLVLVGAHNSIIQTVDQVGLPLDGGNYDARMLVQANISLLDTDMTLILISYTDTSRLYKFGIPYSPTKSIISYIFLSNSLLIDINKC